MNGAHLMNNYGERHLKLVRGEGVYVWDEHGNRYIDAVSGVAVCGLGHCHPGVTAAIQHQAATLVHCSNLYLIEPQIELADRLTAIAGMERAFFCNSGAEANEAAIKLARLYGHKRNVRVPTVIVMETSFHGRTLATLSATAGRKIQAGFEPLVTGFTRAPYDDLDAVRRIAGNNSDVVAVLVEPVQGESGIRVPSPDYLAGLRTICDQQGWLLMLDEIQTGNGRTGRYFAYQHHDLLPDVVTTAKGLGNGVPIGACLARGEAAELFAPGSHGSTFGGNPLASAAALATVEVIDAELQQRVSELGERMLRQFQQSLGSLPTVVDVRGCGLMLGIELTAPCGGLVAQARERGVLINVTAGNVIRLLPPLVIGDREADSVVKTVIELVSNWQPESSS